MFVCLLISSFFLLLYTHRASFTALWLKPALEDVIKLGPIVDSQCDLERAPAVRNFFQQQFHNYVDYGVEGGLSAK
jgi:hypothetical protein